MNNRVKSKKILLTTTENIFLILFPIFVTLIIFPSFVPTTYQSDRGVFVSVAERLVAGDKLYVEVWDNKDPLFFWVLALGRLLSPLADLYVEIFYFLIASQSIFFIARELKLNKIESGFIAFGIAPIIFTGHWYHAGYSHLPGVALCLLGLLFLIREKYFLSGVTFALVFFIKIIIFPLGALFVIICSWILKSRNLLFQVFFGFTLGTFLFIILLFARGELFGYLGMLQSNIFYSNSAVLLDQNTNIFYAHLKRTLDNKSYSALLFLALIQLTLLKPVKASSERTIKILWASAFTSLVCSLLILSVTGLWFSHNQILFVPTVITTTILGWYLLSNRSQQNFYFYIFIFIFLAGSLGNPVPESYRQAFLEFDSRVQSLTTPSKESQILNSLKATGSYSRVGINNFAEHAYGINNWKLECPKFHQYEFDNNQTLSNLSQCLEKSDLIFITIDLNFQSTNPNYTLFLRYVNSLIKNNYHCKKYDLGLYCLNKKTENKFI